MGGGGSRGGGDGDMAKQTHTLCIPEYYNCSLHFHSVEVS